MVVVDFYKAFGRLEEGQVRASASKLKSADLSPSNYVKSVRMKNAPCFTPFSPLIKSPAARFYVPPHESALPHELFM